MAPKSQHNPKTDEEWKTESSISIHTIPHLDHPLVIPVALDVLMLRADGLPAKRGLLSRHEGHHGVALVAAEPEELVLG
jgi:hypothetical protein